MFRWISRWKHNQLQTHNVANRNALNNDAYEGPPAIIKVPNALTEEAEYRQHDRQYKDRQIRTNRWIIAATVITAGGTIWQLCLTRQALRNTEESNRTATDQVWLAISNLNWQAKSMDYSSKQAKSALELSQAENKRTLSASIDTMRIDQRAWISVGNIGGESIQLAVGSAFLTNLGIINTGRTPARKVTTQYNVVLVETGRLPNFSDLPKVTNSGVVGPGSWSRIGKQITPTTKNIDQGIFDRIHSHQSTVFIYGRIGYDDAFGFQHWTLYCYTFDSDNRMVINCEDPSRNDTDKELR